jgi:hypothetical protein
VDEHRVHADRCEDAGLDTAVRRAFIDRLAAAARRDSCWSLPDLYGYGDGGSGSGCGYGGSGSGCGYGGGGYGDGGGYGGGYDDGGGTGYGDGGYGDGGGGSR